MEELRPFIEKSSIVLVAFEQEWPSWAHRKAGAEIFRHAPDKERGRKRGALLRRDLIDPREHAGRRCLAMGTSYNQRLASRQELIMQDRSHRTEGNTRIKNIFKLNIPARNGVANDNEIRTRREIVFRIWLVDRNLQTGQQITHRRVRSSI